MNESLLHKLRMVRPGDVGHIFLFLLALLPAAVCRHFRRGLWLICEAPDEARDNGYWFFRYLRRAQKQIDAVYAIRRNAPERARVAALGEVVRYGSLRHWIYYLAAEVNISSQKSGKPNAAVCYMLEVVLGVLKNRRVFLQHGVIKDDLPFLHEKQAKLSLFICGAEPEYEFVRATFGYPPEAIAYTGLARFDGLYGHTPDPSLLLILPTWRMWLQRGQGEKGDGAFLASAYYREWNALLSDQAFHALLRRHGKRAVFCMHRNMQAFERFMPKSTAEVQMLGWQDADVPALLCQAGALLTDYSSVFMDVAYMEKPVFYYQFDRAAFREGHLPTGYFDYDRDGFGPACTDRETLLKALEAGFSDGCRMQEPYLTRTRRFFTLHDDKNCERTYGAVMELLRRKPEREA